MFMSEGIRPIEQRARSLVLAAGETELGERLLNSPLGKKTLLAGRRAVRSFYERSMPLGRLESWTPAALSSEAINRGALQKPTEFTELLEELSKRDLKNVLEIGTAVGGGVFALCHIAAPGANIVSVGMPHDNFGDNFKPKTETAIRSYVAPGQNLKLIRGNSHDPDVRQEIYDATSGDLIDLLFIDGDHSLHGIQQDFLNYQHLVREGGLVVIHDILQNPLNPECQVPDFWKSFEGLASTREIKNEEEGHWGGYGIIEID
jgi:predicted O-methyltransferase YrrM